MDIENDSVDTGYILKCTRCNKEFDTWTAMGHHEYVFGHYVSYIKGR